MLQLRVLQYFGPSLSYHFSLWSLFCLFLSGRFTQVLLYCNDMVVWGVQWLIGRVVDLGLKVPLFETHWRLCVVSLSKTFYPLVQPRKTGQMSWHDWKIIDWDVKHWHKQKHGYVPILTLLPPITKSVGWDFKPWPCLHMTSAVRQTHTSLVPCYKYRCHVVWLKTFCIACHTEGYKVMYQFSESYYA